MRDHPDKLGRAVAATNGAQTKKSDPGRLERAAIGARVREPFTIPRLDVPAVMTLLAHDRILQVEADLFELMERKKLPLNPVTEIVWECERAARYAAEAVIDPDTINADGGGDWKPIGSLDTWRTKIDPDVLGDVYRFYVDVRTKYDPVGVGCTQEELDAISEIVKKVEAPSEMRVLLLRSFGLRRLSSWLVTTGSLLFSSTIPASSDGASLPASLTPTTSPNETSDRAGT